MRSSWPHVSLFGLARVYEDLAAGAQQYDFPDEQGNTAPKQKSLSITHCPTAIYEVKKRRNHLNMELTRVSPVRADGGADLSWVQT